LGTLAALGLRGMGDLFFMNVAFFNKFSLG
jgi:hypothetical protein